MKLLIAFLLTQMITSCSTTKTTASRQAASTGSVFINPSITVETSFQVNINDIIAACSDIKPCKNILVEDWAANKLHIKIFFNNIKIEEREEMIDRLNALGGVHVIETSG